MPVDIFLTFLFGDVVCHNLKKKLKHEPWHNKGCTTLHWIVERITSLELNENVEFLLKNKTVWTHAFLHHITELIESHSLCPHTALLKH